jgi:hypothetical protein
LRGPVSSFHLESTWSTENKNNTPKPHNYLGTETNQNPRPSTDTE